MGRKAQPQGRKASGGKATNAGSNGQDGLSRLSFTIGGLLLVLAALWQRWSWRDAQSLKKLSTHLRSSGGEVGCIQAASFKYPGSALIRGLAATCDTAAGTRLAQVPDRLVLSDATVDHEVIDLVASSFDGSPHDPSTARDVALAAGLLRERALGARSKFATYLASLPAKAPENLALFDEVQLDALAAVLWDVVLWRRLVLQSVEGITGSRPSLFGDAEEADCQWALAIVISRQVHGRFIPLIDQANHAAEPNAELDCDSSGCHLKALREIEAGSEVTISYGRKPNLHLLQAYGFTAEGGGTSALSLDLGRLNATGCEGLRPVLHHKAPLAVEPKVVACLEQEAGRCGALKALAEGCERLLSRLRPSSGGTSYLSRALGRKESEAALQALEERRPRRRSDAALAAELRAELSVVARCAKEARGALEAAVECLAGSLA